MIVVHNPKVNGVIKKVTNEFCAIFGYTHEEILSKSVATIFPEFY